MVQCDRLVEQFTLPKLAERRISLVKVSVSEAPGQEAQYTRKFLLNGGLGKELDALQTRMFTARRVRYYTYVGSAPRKPPLR